MAQAIVQTLDGLPELLKGEYQPLENGAGFAFKLDGIEDHPRVGALKRAKEREASEATTAKAALKAALDELEALKKDHATLSGEFDQRLRTAVGDKSDDLAKLDEKWGKKLQTAVGEREAKLTRQAAALDKVLVRDCARSIVAAMKPREPEYVDVILPHVMRRLSVELVGDEGRTRVLDNDGKPSADTIEELTEQFRVDKRFAPLLTGSMATGGNASGGNGASAGSAGPINLATATPEQKVAHYKALKGIK